MHKLKELRLLLVSDDCESVIILKKMVMISLTEVFKDIIPDYRIHLQTDKERKQQVYEIKNKKIFPGKVCSLYNKNI